MDDFVSWLVFVVIIMVSYAMGFLIGYFDVPEMKKHAIELQCAQYNPATGEFEWKEQDKN